MSNNRKSWTPWYLCSLKYTGLTSIFIHVFCKRRIYIHFNSFAGDICYRIFHFDFQSKWTCIFNRSLLVKNNIWLSRRRSRCICWGNSCCFSSNIRITICAAIGLWCRSRSKRKIIIIHGYLENCTFWIIVDSCNLNVYILLVVKISTWSSCTIFKCKYLNGILACNLSWGRSHCKVTTCIIIIVKNGFCSCLFWSGIARMSWHPNRITINSGS